MLYDPINIELSEAINYGTSGNIDQSSKILVCSPPTPRDAKLTTYLKQHFWRNLKSIQSQELNTTLSNQESVPNQDEDAITAPAVIICLYMGNLDAYEYQMQFKKLICGEHGTSTLVKINGEVPMTRTHYERLDHEDIDLFMGTYLSFFLLNSLTKILRPSLEK